MVGRHLEALRYLPDAVEIARFEGSDTDEWLANRLLAAWAEEHGLSVGYMQRDEPMGILVESGVAVQKWHNLNGDDRRGLDGIVIWTALPRHGTAVVWARPALVALTLVPS